MPSWNEIMTHDYENCTYRKCYLCGRASYGGVEKPENEWTNKRGNRTGADLVITGMKTFNEVIREGLLERGWEIYPSAGEGLYEFWWKPAEHKGYWRAHNPNDPGKDNCMPIDQAIAWEMREVGN